MSDSYQAIYDAVRSRIHNADIGAAVESAVRDAGFNLYAQQVAEAWRVAAYACERPSVLFRPRVFIDGALWCALYGENVQDGVAGFGPSPDEAMADFDRNWTQKFVLAGGQSRKEKR